VYDAARGYPRIVPYVLYADPAAAIDWLVDVLGLKAALLVTMPDGTVGHAELTLGDQVVMIGLVGGERFGTVSSVTLHLRRQRRRGVRAGERGRRIGHRRATAPSLGPATGRDRGTDG